VADYRVNLDIFAGPLDLLLYLVRKEEVDIYDIPLAKITDQYIHYLDVMKQLDIDVAGDFLVMAATLIHIKSAMLLPKSDPDQIDAEDFNDPRSELIRQLLEYKKFKDAANLLGSAATEHNERFPRPDTIIEKLKPTSEPELDLEQVSVWDLLEAFDTILESVGGKFDISHIIDDTPIDLYQIEILHRLQVEGPMSFERIFESRGNRLVLVGLFLALLELTRDGLITAEQPDSKGTIFLRALTDESAEQAVQKAIFATEAQMQEQQQDETQEMQEPVESLDEIEDSQEPAEPPIPIQEIPPKKKPSQAIEHVQAEDVSSAEQQV